MYMWEPNWVKINDWIATQSTHDMFCNIPRLHIGRTLVNICSSNHWLKMMVVDSMKGLLSELASEFQNSISINGT